MLLEYSVLSLISNLRTSTCVLMNPLTQSHKYVYEYPWRFNYLCIRLFYFLSRLHSSAGSNTSKKYVSFIIKLPPCHTYRQEPAIKESFFPLLFLRVRPCTHRKQYVDPNNCDPTNVDTEKTTIINAVIIKKPRVASSWNSNSEAGKAHHHNEENFASTIMWRGATTGEFTGLTDFTMHRIRVYTMWKDWTNIVSCEAARGGNLICTTSVYSLDFCVLLYS